MLLTKRTNIKSNHVRQSILGLCALASAMVVPTAVMAKGYLATKAEELPELEVGTGNTGYGVSQKEYKLETGKAYSLEIKSTGAKECAWEAPEFTNFIWVRKVEAGDIEIKGSHFYELEFENEGELEIFFVPIKPGTYKWQCRGLAEKGMEGTFVVE